MIVFPNRFESDFLILAKLMVKSCHISPDDIVVLKYEPYGHMLAQECHKLLTAEGISIRMQYMDHEALCEQLSQASSNEVHTMAQAYCDIYEGVTKILCCFGNDPEQLNHPDIQAKLALYKQLVSPVKNKLRSGELHYTLTQIPTPADAALDSMKYEDYLRLFFDSCQLDWDEQHKLQDRLIQKFNTASSLHITNSDGTDITMNIDGFTFANSTIKKNIPGSEIFSAPARDSVQGIIVAKGTFEYDGKIMKNITLKFKTGKLVEAHAEKNNTALQDIINSDKGARYVGEIGIGTNHVLNKHLVNGLLTEKISGSFHVALGDSYSYTVYDGHPVNLNNGNSSIIHWDITTMLSGKDGKMYLDNILVQDNGEWLI